MKFFIFKVTIESEEEFSNVEETTEDDDNDGNDIIVTEVLSKLR